MAGFQFASGDDELIVQVMDTSAQLYLQQSSVDHILRGKQESALVMSSNNALTRPPIKQLSFIKATINDKLYLNYEP